MSEQVEQRTATITLEFGDFPDKGVRPIGGNAEMGGVSTGAVVMATLGVMETLIYHELLELPKVQALVNFKYQWGEEKVPLEDRTKVLLVKLLAHQFMLSRVASRSYVTTGVSSLLSIPRTD